ncbi:MAG: hypothetical protein NXI10_05990 [bacterium]|nr:hypothetical protein [bacterium]
MRKLLIIAGVILASGTVNAQDYYHGLGVQVNQAVFSREGSSTSFGTPGLVYKSTLLFENRRGPSFAVSAYPFLGLSLNFNSQTGGSGGFGAELPVLGELVLGDLDDACFYFGAGFSASYTAYSDPFFGAESGAVVGPQFGLGGQFEIRDRLYGLRAAFTYGVNRSTEGLPDIKTNKFLIGAALYYPFGQ